MTSSSASAMTIFSQLILSLVSLVPLLLLCEGSGNTTLLISVDLIHRDSSHSPFYNHSEKPIERLHNSIQRSFSRAAAITKNVQHNFLKSSYSRISTPASPVPPPKFNNTNITSIVSPDHGAYLMKLSIGTPPLQIFAFVDTASDLIWTQRKPCHVCYRQTLPIFNPADSSTYKDLVCASQQCQALLFSGGGYSCEGDHYEDSRCSYSYSYVDGSSTAGYLANETLTFDSTNGTPVALPSVLFGCGHNNRGDNEENWCGLVGLGGGPLSLISQLGLTVGWKFSYCLVPQSIYDIGTEENSSKLHFGSVADQEVTGEGVVSTPMVPMFEFVNNFYAVSLEGISVGGNRIDITPSNSSSAVHEGHNIMIVDSGTTFTYLSPDLYGEVEQELKIAIKAKPAWPPAEDLSLCYNADDALKIPNITFHFTGADVELPPLNTFMQIPTFDQGEILCFAFYPQPQDILPIFGNIAQTNFLIEFDVKERIVKFKKMDCTRPL